MLIMGLARKFLLYGKQCRSHDPGQFGGKDRLQSGRHGHETLVRVTGWLPTSGIKPRRHPGFDPCAISSYFTRLYADAIIAMSA